MNPITQRLYHIVYIHKISKQYEYFNNDEDYNSVQRLHHIKYTPKVSVLVLPLLGIDIMTKATLIKANL